MEETRTFTREEFVKEATKVITTDVELAKNPMALLMAAAIVAILDEGLFKGKTPNIKEEGIENE